MGRRRRPTRRRPRQRRPTAPRPPPSPARSTPRSCPRTSDALCAALQGLADIDPDADPTQAQVDRLRAIADTAPSGVAEPLLDVATFGQLGVDAGATVDSLPEDAAAIQGAAVEAATILIAYGNEACGIDVPLFDTIAGV